MTATAPHAPNATVRVFVPRDVVALALGADTVAVRLAAMVDGAALITLRPEPTTG